MSWSLKNRHLAKAGGQNQGIDFLQKCDELSESIAFGKKTGILQTRLDQRVLPWKVPVAPFQKMLLFIMIWLTILEILGFKVKEFS